MNSHSAPTFCAVWTAVPCRQLLNFQLNCELPIVRTMNDDNSTIKTSKNGPPNVHNRDLAVAV